MAEPNDVDAGPGDEVDPDVVLRVGEQAADAAVHIEGADLRDPAAVRDLAVRGGNGSKESELFGVAHRFTSSVYGVCSMTRRADRRASRTDENARPPSARCGDLGVTVRAHRVARQ